MQIKVGIHSTEVNARNGVSARTGKPYSIREQEAWVALPGSPYPQKARINLENDEPPYEVGTYEISPASFFIGGYERLEIRLRLNRASRQAPQQPKAVAS